MSVHTNKVQIINDSNGMPAFAVIPYTEYTNLINAKPIELELSVPSEVVNLVFDNGYTPMQAWREYLNLSQEEVALKIGVSQSAYSQYEAAEKPRKQTKIKVAEALGIKPEQLDF